MGIFDDIAKEQQVQEQEKKKNLLISFLGRVGDVVSRPSYAVGNAIEAAGYQGSKLLPWTSNEDLNRAKDIMGDVNPLTALYEGLSGKDKVGPGDALARAVKEADVNPALKTTLGNPVTAFALNILTDPTIAGGTLNKGTKLSTALEGVGKGEDAGRLAKIAGRIVKPESIQNLNLASKGAAANPALAVPGAALLGGARRFSPKLDETIRALYGSKGSVDDLARGPLDDALELANKASTMGRPVDDALELAYQDALKTIAQPKVSSLAGSEKALLSGLSSGVSTNPLRAVGPVDRIADFSQIERLPSNLLRRSVPNPVDEMLALNPAPVARIADGANASSRQEAIAKLIKNKNASETLGKSSYTGRSPSGSFLTKSVVQDADQLRSMLDDPNTRVETIKMLQRLFNG